MSFGLVGVSCEFAKEIVHGSSNIGKITTLPLSSSDAPKHPLIEDDANRKAMRILKFMKLVYHFR